MPEELQRYITDWWKFDLLGIQPERLNPRTSKGDAIVRTSDESGRDEPEAVCPPGDRS